MNDRISVRGNHATIMSPLTPAAGRQLQEARPTELELIGDWSDLSPLRSIAPTVELLHVAGSTKQGKIKAAKGLEAFVSLRKLRFASVVAGGYDLARLESLENLDVAWQPEVAPVFTHPGIRALTIRSFPDKDLCAITVGARACLSKLWLAAPRLETFEGIEKLKNLTDLRVTDAKRLRSTRGLKLRNLTVLDIENASSLSDVSNIESLTALQTLRLNSISDQANLSALARVRSLQRLQIGGRGSPSISWPEVVRLPFLQKVFAWWDPEVLSADSICAAAERTGRKVLRTEAMSGRGRRMLLVELA